MLRKLLDGFAAGVVIGVAALGLLGAWYLIAHVAVHYLR